MAEGRNKLLFVSPTGVTTTGLLEVPLQGDMDIDTGKSVQATSYKNGQSAAQTSTGFSVTVEVGNTAPLSAAEQRMWDLHDSGDLAYFEIQDSEEGGLEWSFIGRVAIPRFSAPVSGPTSASFVIYADGEPTRSVSA